MSQSQTEPKKDIFDNENDVNVTLESQLFNFYNIFKNNPVIIWYYAKWCGHCVTFVDDWNKFVLECKSKYPSVKCVKLESSLLPKLNFQHGVNSFPTIKFYNNGVETEKGAFNLKRNVDNLLNYVNENLEHQDIEKSHIKPKIDLNDINEKFKLKNYHKEFNKKRMMLWYYAPWCVHCKNMNNLWENFKRDCKTKYPSVRVVKVESEQLDNLNYKHGVQGFPTIIYYNKGKQSKLGEFTGQRKESNLMKYLKDNLKTEEEPKIVELNNNTVLGKKNTKKNGIQLSTIKSAKKVRKKGRSRSKGKGKGRGRGRSRGRGKSRMKKV